MPPAAHVDFPADGVGIVLIDNPPMNFGSWELMERVDEAIQKVKASEAKVVILASDVPGYFIGHAWLVDAIAMLEGREPSGDFAAWARWRARTAPRADGLDRLQPRPGLGWRLRTLLDLRPAHRGRIRHLRPARGDPGDRGGRRGHLPPAANPGGSARQGDAAGRRAHQRRHRADLGVGEPRLPRRDPWREETIKWAAKIATRPAWSLQASKKALGVGLELTFRDALTKEQEIFRALSEGHEAETLALLKAAQAKYDAGDDSYQAWGLEADRNNPTDLF